MDTFYRVSYELHEKLPHTRSAGSDVGTCLIKDSRKQGNDKMKESQRKSVGKSQEEPEYVKPEGSIQVLVPHAPWPRQDKPGLLWILLPMTTQKRTFPAFCGTNIKNTMGLAASALGPFIPGLTAAETILHCSRQLIQSLSLSFFFLFHINTLKSTFSQSTGPHSKT